MKALPFSQDALEFLHLLHQHGVRYVLIGGAAVIYHGYARLTGDFLDVLAAQNTGKTGPIR